MGVKEELEHLRQQGVTKTHAAALASRQGAGLSTPEEEEAALRAEQKRLRVGNYSRDAEENLKSFNEARALVGGARRSTTSSRTFAKEEQGLTKGDGIANGSSTVPRDARDDFNDDDDDDDDDDVPELEEQDDGATDGIQSASKAHSSDQGKQINRAEKKARIMMLRLSMRPVRGISQVTFKPSGNNGGVYFAIDQPDVYEKKGKYIIFGRALQSGGMQNQAAMRQAKAAKQLTFNSDDDDVDVQTFVSTVGGGGDDDKKKQTIDESGVEAKDVDLVMSQASCSRSRAVAALRENDGDLVNAIMSLTT